MIKKCLFAVLLAFAAFVASAQDYKILSVIGKVEYRKGNAYVPASRRLSLSAGDNLRLGDNSAVSILNDKDKKVYSYGKKGDVTVGEVVKVKTSALKRYFDHFVSSLRSGSTDDISFNANVVYRAANSEEDIYYALADDNRHSDLSLSLGLIDGNGDKVGSTMNLGDRFIFRVTNSTAQPLFVNVLSVDADGVWFDCLPMDSGGTMSHLLIPAESTVDLTEYVMEITEPGGYNRFTLTACDAPFDLRRVIAMRNGGQKVSAPQTKVGTYNKIITIK